MTDDNEPPYWLTLLAHQITPDRWCIPVETIWRRYGWKPPSTECAETMAKHKAFRTWTLPPC